MPHGLGATRSAEVGLAATRECCRCNVCGAPQATALFAARDHLSGEEFVVVRCDTCGLCYVTPRPRSGLIDRYYPEAYFGKRHPFLPGLMNQLRVRKLPRFGGTPRLLDVGCGHGDFILRCRQQGWLVAGVEQKHSPVMALKHSLGVEIYELAELKSLPAEHFDVITFWHVLEHLADPAGTLAEVRRLLKPGGVVLIEVPNFGGWEGRFSGPAWFHLDLPRHLYHFVKPALARLLEQQGLVPRRWQTFSFEYDAFGLAQSLLNRISSRPNHLFQLLIRRGTANAGGFTDGLLSLVLCPFLLAAGLIVSLSAAACGQGGVLRVWAEKPLTGRMVKPRNP